MTATSTSNENPMNKSYKLAPNSAIARVCLAFLATAGIFYVNIMPALVNGLKEGLMFTNQQAGFVSSANLYGAAIGSFAAVLMIKKINWRRWSYGLLMSLLVIDLLCVYIESASVMIAVRGLHGITGGLLVGIGFCIMSRTTESDKTFGYLLFIQWGLGGLGIMYLPAMVPVYGTGILFISLIAFTLITLLMLPFLPSYPVSKESSSTAKSKVLTLPLMLTLAAIFLFQAANMGLFAYVIGLGKAEGLSLDFMSPALAMASWIALLGSFLVIIIGTKFGRSLPILLSVMLTAICTWLLHYSEVESIYLITNVVIGITWAFALSYLFGLCSEFDKAGQMAALGGFASKMGLASGPMVAAMLLGDDHYGLVINISAMALIACALIAMQPAITIDKRISRGQNS
ncbi:MFS transporter [Thalassotalea sp. Y01]|uniref:MFS transporter n=1 Tax=Thalassotalea sp. Y01 TaxID=2729613 RepID=UPI0020070850|nr:MFS transporter [Thalassotalea sp. Y01]